MQKIKFSVATSSRGNLTKSVRLLPDGGVETVKADTLYSGDITEHSCTPEEFGGFLRSLDKNQAIICGVTGLPTTTVTTATKLNYERELSSSPDQIITRSIDYISHPRKPGLLLLDHDKAQADISACDPTNPAALEPITPGGLMMIIAQLCGYPEILQAASVSTGSSSAFIYTDSGAEIRGAGYGFHTYLFAENASDIPRFTETLFKRLFLAGWGHIRSSKAGAGLARGIIDASVGSPERLVYDAGAITGPGLEQRLPDPVYTAGGLLRTENLLSLTEEEEKVYQSIVNNILASAKPLLTKIRDGYEHVEAKKLTGIPLPEALEIVRQRAEGVLLDSDILFFQREPSGVTVAEVLREPEKWDKKSLSDPREPDYNSNSLTAAKFYWNDGKPFINSFAHGGCGYKFAQFPSVSIITDIDPAKAFGGLKNTRPCKFVKTGYALPDDIPDLWSYSDAMWILSDSDTQKWYHNGKTNDSIDVSPLGWTLINDVLKHNSFKKIEMGLISGRISALFGLNATDVRGQAKELKAEMFTENNQEVSWGHTLIAEDFLARLQEKDQKIIGAEGDLWVYQQETGVFERTLVSKLAVAIGQRYVRSKYNQKTSDHGAVARKIYDTVFEGSFFEKTPIGVPCKDKFYQINSKGELSEREYSPKLRQRFKFDFNLIKGELPKNSKFGKWLQDSFHHVDPVRMKEQIDSFQMALGSIVAGLGGKTQQAVFLIGGGRNGKSVLIEFLCNLFPSDEVGHVSPLNFSDSQQMATLVGKRINLTGDVGKDKKIPAGIFKHVTGGDEPINAKKVYLPVFSFLPIAAHVFSANDYPLTDDWSEGFKRRWAIFRFLNRVPISEKIEHLGKMIAEEEAGHVLNWCLEGAVKLAANHYHIPETAEHYAGMADWKSEMNTIDAFFADTDTIRAKADSEVQIMPNLYNTYCDWCKMNRRSPYGGTKFKKRLRLDFKTRTDEGVGIGRFLEGYEIINNCMFPIV